MPVLHGINLNSYSSPVMSNNIFVKYLPVRYCCLSFLNLATLAGVSLNTVYKNTTPHPTPEKEKRLEIMGFKCF